jgi:hypothetical protein
MNKLDQIRANAVATRARKNTPEASGKARKAPSVKAVSASAPMTNTSRISDRASPPSQAKPEPKQAVVAMRSKTASRDKTAGIRITVGRTTEAAGQSAIAPAAPILKRGRPKLEGKRPWEIEGMSRRSWYRRQKGK